VRPYYTHDGVMILQGHVLDVLRGMEPESIQCCVTSPPYWGLRDYGLEPQIWDAQEGCVHVWGDEIIRSHEGGGNDGVPKEWQRPSRDAHKGGSSGQFCQLCGAWRGSLGLEPTPELYIKHMADIFREVRRVLKKDGVCWLNLGDSYAGGGKRSNHNGEGKSTMGWPGQDRETLNKVVGMELSAVQHGLKPKDLCMIPARVALALQAEGWWLRSDIIWNKPNPMPESVTDRPTKAHEYIFLLTKSAKYYYDADAVREELKTEPHSPGWRLNVSERNDRQVDNEANQREWGSSKGRNKRSVWTIPTHPYPQAHFAVFPEKLIEPCILAGSRIGDTILDPFGGSGTAGRVAKRLNRKAVLIELNPEYCEMSTNGLAQGVFQFPDSGRTAVNPEVSG